MVSFDSPQVIPMPGFARNRLGRLSAPPCGSRRAGWRLVASSQPPKQEGGNCHVKPRHAPLLGMWLAVPKRRSALRVARTRPSPRRCQHEFGARPVLFWRARMSAENLADGNGHQPYIGRACGRRRFRLRRLRFPVGQPAGCRLRDVFDDFFDMDNPAVVDVFGCMRETLARPRQVRLVESYHAHPDNRADLGAD